jgi:hypothetical protein
VESSRAVRLPCKWLLHASVVDGMDASAVLWTQSRLIKQYVQYCGLKWRVVRQVAYRPGAANLDIDDQSIVAIRDDVPNTRQAVATKVQINVSVGSLSCSYTVESDDVKCVDVFTESSI